MFVVLMISLLACRARVAVHLSSGEQNGAVDRYREQIYFVSIHGKRLYALHCGFASGTRVCLVDGLALKRGLGLRRTADDGRCCSHGDDSAAADVSIHLEYDASVGDRPVEALFLSVLLIGGAGACGGFRNDD